VAFAIFTDIHGNLEAMEAILRDIHKRRHKISQTFFLGDAVTFGSDSSACLKLLQKYNVNCVVGNHEQRLFKYEKTVAEMTPAGIKHMEYIFRSLDNDDIRFIKSMPLELSVDYKGYKLHFAHYTHDENGVVLEDMDYFREDLLDKLFKDKDCDVAFLGHLHERKLYIRSTGRSYFCLDSSGCVYGDKTHYTYFDIGATEKNNFDIYRHEVKFDRAKFDRKMHERPIPEKERFGKKYFGIDFSNSVDNPQSDIVDLSIGDDK